MERRKAVKSRLLSGNSGFRWIFVDDSTDANDPLRKCRHAIAVTHKPAALHQLCSMW
jgi:hypothetical protein